MFLYKKFVWYPSSSFPDGTGHLPASKRLTFKFQEQTVVSWSKYWKKRNCEFSLGPDEKSQSNSHLQAQSWTKKVQSKLKKNKHVLQKPKSEATGFQNHTSASMLIFQSNPHSGSWSFVANVGHGLHVSTHMAYAQGYIDYIYSYL